MATKGRKPGQLVRCTCTQCGAVELWRGCTTGFQCLTCQPLPTAYCLQYQAHKAVADAILAGDLRRPAEFTCTDCDKPATDYDHRDYNKPLEVDPVCRSCNVRRGPAVSSSSPIPYLSRDN